MADLDWIPLTDDVWTAEHAPTGGMPLRTVAVALTDGGTLICSPIRACGNADHPVPAGAGDPSVLLAPNHFHNLGLPRWQARFPAAQIVSSERAQARLAKRLPELTFGGLDALRGRLPESVTLLEPEGTANGEVWLRIATADGIVWVVSDAWFSVKTLPAGALGVVSRLLRVAPGLQVGRTWLWIALKRRNVYRTWVVKQLTADRPTTLVTGHGEILRGADLSDRLMALVNRYV